MCLTSFLSFPRPSFPLFVFLFIILILLKVQSVGRLQKQLVIEQLNWRTEILSLSLRWKLTSLELFL